MNRRFLIGLPMLLIWISPARADWPMFGGSPSRNMANTVDKNIPIDFAVDEGPTKVRWSAELGTKVYGGPIVADGKVFVGTNNATPRDPKVKGANKAVLMAFDAAKGTFLWQIVHDIPPLDFLSDVMTFGLLSTPVVDGKFLYYVLPSGEVVCASTDGKVQWTYDTLKELGVYPYHCCNCSPLVVDDLVMVITSNGVKADQEGNIAVAAPNAPSFIALAKKDGKLAWKSSLPGKNIIEGQWTNPAALEVAGKKQVIFPGGDGVLYSLKPEDGSLIWKFNCRPQKLEKEGITPNYFVATPVCDAGKVYIGMGLYPEHATGGPFSHFLCIDAGKTGDVSPHRLDMNDPANKGSALAWAFGGPIVPRPAKGRPVNFGRTISTCAVQDGLVYISEETGYLHCLDAKTGQRYWMHDFKSAVWGSPYYVDGKIFTGVEDGYLWVLEAGKTLKVLANIDMGEGMQSTPVVSGGTL